MKSIIIQHKENKDITLSKITLLANQLNIHSQLELTLIYTIHKIYKNNPLQNNHKTQQNLQLDIIQIIQQHANNHCFVKKEPTISAINNAIWKIIKKGGLIEIDGLYVLNSCFKDIDQVEQIVFRFNNAVDK